MWLDTKNQMICVTVASYITAVFAVPNEGGTSNSVIYTVVAGDSLWKIAKAHLGSGFKWNAIYEANKDTIKSPNLLFVGQKLVIPGVK